MKEETQDAHPYSTTTPITEAGIVLSALIDIWAMWTFEEKIGFLDRFFKTMWDDPDLDAEKKIAEIQDAEDLEEWDGAPLIPGFKAAAIQLATIQVPCAFAVQAMKASKGIDCKRNQPLAWHYVGQAWHWLGILQGILSGRSIEKEGASKITMSELGKMGANAAHAENRALKKTVFEWCDNNMNNFKSMDRAAEAVAGKLVPMTFRTVRSWISEWKRQSAGTL